MNERVLIVDDETTLQKSLTTFLKEGGYISEIASSGESALKKLSSGSLPDLILLDINLPGMDGFDVCRKIKSDVRTQAIPVILISSRAEEIDVVVGLEIGAEDYVIKPFRRRELLARIKTALRKKFTRADHKIVESGKLRVDFEALTATYGGASIDLTPKETQLLGFFLKREGQAVSRSTISEEVWGMDLSSSSRTIDVHVEKLRRKLEAFNVEITGLKGIGYRFEVC